MHWIKKVVWHLAFSQESLHSLVKATNLNLFIFNLLTGQQPYSFQFLSPSRKFILSWIQNFQEVIKSASLGLETFFLFQMSLMNKRFHSNGFGPIWCLKVDSNILYKHPFWCFSEGVGEDPPPSWTWITLTKFWFFFATLNNFFCLYVLFS